MKWTYILIDKPKREKPKRVRTPQNIGAVAASVHEASLTSIYHRSQQLNISETSLRWISHKYFGMMPYKAQKLKLIEHVFWLRYVSLRSIYRRCWFKKKTPVLSDEAYFDVGGYVNKQIAEFGAQKTRTHTLKSWRPQNESLFGADFGPEA